MLQKPHQRLAHSAEFDKLTEDKLNRALHTQVRVFFQALVIALM